MIASLNGSTTTLDLDQSSVVVFSVAHPNDWPKRASAPYPTTSSSVTRAHPMTTTWKSFVSALTSVPKTARVTGPLLIVEDLVFWKYLPIYHHTPLICKNLPPNLHNDSMTNILRYLQNNEIKSVKANGVFQNLKHLKKL